MNPFHHPYHGGTEATEDIIAEMKLESDFWSRYTVELQESWSRIGQCPDVGDDDNHEQERGRDREREQANEQGHDGDLDRQVGKENKKNREEEERHAYKHQTSSGASVDDDTASSFNKFRSGQFATSNYTQQKLTAPQYGAYGQLPLSIVGTGHVTTAKMKAKVNGGKADRLPRKRRLISQHQLGGIPTPLMSESNSGCHWSTTPHSKGVASISVAETQHKAVSETFRAQCVSSNGLSQGSSQTRHVRRRR